MESISLKLSDELLKTTDRLAKTLAIPRAEYIRRALQQMNREAEARARAERMAKASRRVRKESMRVNAEFAAIERDPDDA
jgi:metal-responsive CopG/Arc/MetJ family transcriptional regulator